MAFFSKLMGQYGIDLGQWDIAYPKNQLDQSPSGVSAYPAHLRALQTSGDIRSVSRLLIVADNDSDPAATYRGLRKRLREVRFHLPESPLEIGDGPPKIAALMLPWSDQPGCLETLMLEAVFALRPRLEDCVKEHCKCCTPDSLDWPISRLSKSRLHAIIAGCCKEPAASLAFVWSKDGNPIPIDSAAFDRIAEFLKTFAAA